VYVYVYTHAHVCIHLYVYRGVYIVNVISVINQKGGVGKSTTALALGSGLFARGFKVLFVDMDAQGNLTYALGADNGGLTVFDVLTGASKAARAMQNTKHGALLTSSPALSGSDTVLTQTGKEYCLKEALDALSSDFDYVIIDTPPALGILTINALTASAGVIIPAQADIFSLQGITQLYGTLEAVLKYCNPALKVMGILLTRYQSRSIISREVAEMIEESAKALDTKLYNAKIRENTAIKEAQARRSSIFDYAPKSNAAADYNDLLDEILGV